MKKLLIIGVTCLALAGCQTAQDVATTITTATQTTKEKVKSVQGYAVSVCGYLPAAASVVGIFNSGFGNSVAAVGSAICNAVTSIPLADGPGDRLPRVNGVIIKGSFVK
jgi:hypothetical protein